MNEIRVYGKSGCVQCKMTTNVLAKEHIPHSYSDIEELKQDVIDEKGRIIKSLPIVVTPQGNWGGFSPDKLYGLRELAETPKDLM